MKKLLVSLLIIFSMNLTFSQGSGNSIDLNGINQSINLGNNVATGIRTIEMWFKLDNVYNSSSTNVSTLIVRDYNSGDGLSLNEFGIAFSQSSWANPGKLIFFKRDVSALKLIYSNQNNWNAGQWYHVAGVVDPISGMKIYINGELQSMTDPSTLPIGNQTGSITDNVHIGQWGNLNVRNFDGEIDEVRLWNLARNQTEIREKMCSKLQGTEFGLKAYYRLDNISGLQVTDNSLNFNHGILNNSPARIFSGAPIGDTSTYSYSFSLATTSLTMNSAIGDVFNVDAINASATGIHIYRVDAAPNSLSNLKTLITPNYYGTFLTDNSSSYRINYDYSGYSCSSKDTLKERNDNSETNWTYLSPNTSMCNFNLGGQSRLGQFYRAEYIINYDSITPIDSTTNSDTSSVEVCLSKFIMPNVFSPNNDRVNDFFKPLKSECLFEFNIKIYNRWGQIVYKSSEFNFSWNGKYNNKECSAGAYFWTATYLDENKKTINDKGFLTLFN